MTNIFNMIYNNYINIVKMAMFDLFRTGNTAFDTIMSTFIISFFGICLNYIDKYQIYKNQIELFL